MGLQNIPVVGSGQALLHSRGEEKLNHLRQYLRFLCSRSSATSSPQDNFWTLAKLENEIPILLLTALTEGQQPLDNTPLRACQKGLQSAISFIDETAHNDPRIPDICIACNLSWRTLSRVFKEYFGIGPKRYLLQLRLIRVRQQLKKAPPNARVSDIANAWGFWHMGDFAQKYRKLFGEYPTEQLRKPH